MLSSRSLRPYFLLEARAFALRGPVFGLVAGAAMIAITHLAVPRLPPIALGVHATKAGTRAVSSATTLGAGNPIVSFIEDVLAVMILIFTVLAPVLAVALVILLCVLAARAWRRMRRKLGTARPPAAEPPAHSA